MACSCSDSFSYTNKTLIEHYVIDKYNCNGWFFLKGIRTSVKPNIFLIPPNSSWYLVVQTNIFYFICLNRRKKKREMKFSKYIGDIYFLEVNISKIKKTLKLFLNVWW
jgi:hypothetical protein